MDINDKNVYEFINDYIFDSRKMMLQKLLEILLVAVEKQMDSHSMIYGFHLLDAINFMLKAVDELKREDLTNDKT